MQQPITIRELERDIENIVTPWSTVGYLTYKRTYARKLDESLPDDSPTEEFEDTADRVIEACDRQLNCGFSLSEELRLKQFLLNLKFSVAGRFMWQLGTKTVDRIGLASLQNCAFTTVDEPIRPFTWAMDMLALGSGVGYNIQRENVAKIPSVKTHFSAPRKVNSAGADFIVPDSREGWVKLLGKVLKSAFLSKHKTQGTFTFSTQVVRGKGAPIKGFGGVASGPEDLVWGIGQISKVLERRRGRQIRPIDALDIMNIIGHIIVAGNVRRSAQIAIGDADDIDFLRAKRWDLGGVPNWRAMSNNSVVCNDIRMLNNLFWETYEVAGEPYGLINLELSRAIGRTGEYQYPDPDVMGYNPCAEQSLADKETCCLAEIFLPNIDSYEELLDVLEYAYRICKHSLTLPCHHHDTQEIVHSNMRMGIGMTGVLQASTEQRVWLKTAYEYLREYDAQYSKENNFPQSIKLTTVKPSGTLSLLPGTTPGIHPAYAQYMYRRIRIATNHPLVESCRKAGYPIEPALNQDGSFDHNTMVATFPFAHPEGTILAEEMSAIDQLKEVSRMQREWSDNSVSCTVYYRKEELEEIKEYLKENYKDNHKSLSFLLHSDHGFVQAPLEKISKEVYDALVANTEIITSVDYATFEADDECASGMCPVR